MISKEELRLSKKSSEILSNFVRFSIKKGHGFLWQATGKMEKRKIWPVQLVKVDIDTRTIVFGLYPEASIPSMEETKCLDLEELDHAKELFFKGEERDILFKIQSGNFSTHRKLVLVTIPLSVFLKENRKAERFVPKESISLSVRTSMGGPTLNLDCKNFGEGGFGLTLSYSNAHLFKRDQLIYIERIGDIVLPKDIGAQVSYVRKYHEERERKILMGVSYVQPLSQSVLRKLVTLFH
ncbi:MAG: hypothetical protein NXH75_03765 [Halobacteriovoraceae bacterium]|nr:hypothetical protein [Halobacteriovoraceae bacterium]